MRGVISLFVLALLCAPSVFAQEESRDAPASEGVLSTPVRDVSKMRSLFFTQKEKRYLDEALTGVTPEAEAEFAEDWEDIEGWRPEEEEKSVVAPVYTRELYLSGIVYKNAKDWVVWLNGMRMTPQSVPDMVQDLRVHKEYVEFKWLDQKTNAVFPVRLRAHQHFNLDERVFVTGAGE